MTTVTLAGRPVAVDARRLAAVARTIPSIVRTEIARQSLAFKVWLGAMAALLGILAVSAAIAIPPGWEVFGTTPAFEWGLLISAYVFFVVTTSGLCLVSGLGQVVGVKALQPIAKRATILALLFLVAGFVIISLDLHYPIRLLFGVVLSPSLRSPMWWMGVLYAVYMVFLLIELGGMVFGIHRLAKLGSTLAFGNAIFAPATLGLVFGSLSSRPYWHGALVPAQLILTAVLSGAAILAIVCVVALRFGGRDDEETARAIPAVGSVLGVVLAAAAVFTAWQTGGAMLGSAAQADAARALVWGPLSIQFWGFKVGLGLVVPLAILAITRARSRRGVFVAALLTFVGVFVDRLVLVNAGQIAPISAASGIVPAGHAAYTPSIVEIGIVLGAAGFVGFFYTIAERFFDLTEHAHERDPQVAS